MAPKRAGFYGVRVGRIRGVFSSWSECQKSVNGHPKALYRKFKTRQAAAAFVRGAALNVPLQAPSPSPEPYHVPPFEAPLLAQSASGAVAGQSSQAQATAAAAAASSPVGGAVSSVFSDTEMLSTPGSSVELDDASGQIFYTTLMALNHLVELREAGYGVRIIPVPPPTG